VFDNDGICMLILEIEAKLAVHIYSLKQWTIKDASKNSIYLATACLQWTIGTGWAVPETLTNTPVHAAGPR
jgi:hypothetical protein